MATWYRQWYSLNAAGEKEMRAALADPETGAATRGAISQRLNEMKALSDDRCHISLEQRRALERILSS